MCNVKLAELPNWNPPVLAFDLETTGLDPISDRPLSIAISDGEWVWIWLHIHELPKRLWELLTNPDIVKIAHYAEFDMRFLKYHYGIEVNNIWDTLVVEQILNNGKGIPNGLYDVAARRCGILMDKDTRNEFIGHPGFDVRPVTSEQIKYMAEDVLYLPNIRKQQQKEVSEDRLGKVVKLELDTIPIVVDLKLNGNKLDTELWNLYEAQIVAKIELIEKHLYELLGSEFILSVERTRKGEKVIEDISLEDIKWNSPSQMKTLLNGMLPKDISSTGVEVLQELSDDAKTPESIREFILTLLEHRNWSKMLGWQYPKYVHEITGKVHPDWRQMGAGTGRMSCSNPNFQNIPRPHEGEPNLRQLWVPDSEEYVLLVADYSQQEPRILGQLCQDQRLLEACNAQDVYIEFARHLYGYDVEKGSEERYIAKQFVLATGYGAMPWKLHLTSGLPLERCEEIRNMILSTFPGIRRWGQEQYTKLKHFGYITTLMGRRRYFPNKNQRIYTVAVNGPVQGTAAEMMKLALINVNSYLRNSKFNARIWATVHDELEVHVHRNQANDLLPEIFRLMEEAGSSLCPDVTHIAEGKIMDRWDK